MPGPANAPNDWPAAATELEPDRAAQVARARGRPTAPRRTSDRPSGARSPVRQGPPGRGAPRRCPASSGDAGWPWRTSRPAGAGSARRAADAPHGAAPMTGASRGPAAGPRRQQPAALPDDLADGARPDRGELAAEVLGQGVREALDLLGRAGELGPEVLALGGDAGGAGVEVALAGHVAAERDERRPSRTRTPPRRGAPRRAGRGRSGGRRPTGARRDRGGRCGAGPGGPRRARAPTARRRA